MKAKLFSIILVIIIISSVSFSQSIKFDSYSLTITELKTNEYTEIDTDVQLELTDYSLTVIDTGKKWKLTGDTIRETERSFGIYAYDIDNESKCKIWLKTSNGLNWIISIKYPDYEIEYDCLYVE